jgi:hypothetical protein
VVQSLFFRTLRSIASSKSCIMGVLFMALLVGSSWNLRSFSKINIHIGDVHHTADNVSNSVDSANKPQTTNHPTTTNEQPQQPEAASTLSPLAKIENGIKELASAGFDPFSISLVNPKMEIKQNDIEKLSPFYQLLITQNKDIKVVLPPAPKKTPEQLQAEATGGTFNPSAGGIAVEAIPVIPNPMEGMSLAGVSYMPKRSFAMINVSGQSNAAIVSQGQVLDVAGQKVKVVSIARGTVSLQWVGAPKGVRANQKLTIPDIIGYQSTGSNGNAGGGGGSASPSAANTPASFAPSPEGTMPFPSTGTTGGKKPAPPLSNTPEAIEKLVNEAMKP